MVLYSRSSAAADGTRRDPNSGLEESMRRLALGSNSKDPYPERPGEQDCSYFIRTGSCSYGARCRYNHSHDHGDVRNSIQLGALEYPERVGQPVCEQYFVKTGKCRFGSTCKYHHPKEGVGSVSLNHYGFPLRQGEKDCSYYVKTGQCKFGSTCRFNHPEAVSTAVSSPAPSLYPIVQPTSVPSPQEYPSLHSWQVGGPSISPASYMPGSYGPVLISPSSVSVPGWSPYPPSINPAVSPGGQQMVQTGLSYGPMYQSSPSTLAHAGPYPPTALSIIHRKEYKLPERPGQPICQYYVKTGVCKFGTMCKYHHPSPWYTPDSNCILSPLGLPFRPGARPCPEFAQHNICNFGHMIIQWEN